MAVETGPPVGLWQIVQPWITGLFAPAATGAFVVFKWRREEARRAKIADDSHAKTDAEFRLKDRAQIAAEQEALRKRADKEIADLTSDLKASRTEARLFAGAFYNLHEMARDFRHDANNRLQAMLLLWQRKRVAPEEIEELPPIPAAADLLNAARTKDHGK